MFVDSHARLSLAASKSDARDVLKRTLEKDVWVVMPGTQFENSKRAVELAQEHEQGVYAAVGLHPIHLGKRRVDVLGLGGNGEEFLTRGEEFDYEKYKIPAQNKKTVAIGEVGLDYYEEPKGKAAREAFRLRQKTALALQLKLAQELGLPVIFHCRKAHDELLEFLSNYQLQTTNYKLQGVVHCYTGNLVQAEKFYAMGLLFGFNGLIFKNVPALPSPVEIIRNLPLERILLETDAPYLTPPGVGAERNEPLFVEYVAKEIARIKGVSFAEVAEQTTQNAKTLFNLQ